MKSMMRKSKVYHWYNGHRKPVRDSATWWKRNEERLGLQNWLDKHKLPTRDLREGEFPTCDFVIVRRIVEKVNELYASRQYYLRDQGETWNTPLETIAAFESRYSYNDPNEELGTDCDNFAHLIYGLCRAAGVPAKDLRLCILQTITERHMNVMYLENGKVPFALEGTYYPSVTMYNFGKVPYMQNKYKGRMFFEALEFVFNENGSWINRLYKEVGT